MGAGLSMASVNKIKELANSREYSLALELVEHQDLSKSLNPQFLRLCGEIYIKNNRYEDARRCLIMAHRLAPESKRIMYVFVELYLRMGYFELAKTYYDMYMFDAGSCDSRQMEYVWTKHEHPDALKDMEQLIASYMHNLDYDWSFELYLVYKKEEKKEEAHSLAELYAASFKNSENSDRICAIEKGKESADTYFDVYASVQQEDNDEKYDALRSEEAELLVADDLRMHPKEAEITVMYEDAFTPAGSEKKVQKMLKKQDREEERKEKKLLKEQRKQEKKLEKEAAKAENPEEETTLEASAAEETKPETAVETVTEETKPETVAETVTEETKPETAVEAAKETKPETVAETVTEETKPETAVEAAAEETKPETAVEATVEKEEIEEVEIEKSKKRGLFSKIFRKKKEVEDDTTEYAELVQTSESEIIDAYQDDRPSENSDAEKAAETETVHAESETDSNETIDTMTTGQANDMRHKSKTMAKNVVVVDDDNDFEAEADTIEELAAKEKSDVEKKIEDKKPAFEFQTVELAPDDFEDQFQVDDFSDKLDAEFGEMKSYEPEPRIEIEVEESETEEPIIEEPEAEAEELEVETEELEIKEPEVEIEEPEAETEEPEVEPELEVEEPEVEIEESEAETGEPEAEEPEAEIEEPETEAEEPEVEPELEIEEPEAEIEEPEAGQPEVEPEPESIIEESETEPDLEIEEPEVEIEKPEVESEPESIIEESETEPELEIEEPEVEAEEPEVESEPEAEEPEFRVAPFTTKPEKKKLDFPVFKSSLFPDYHKEVKNVENNFDEIMEEAQDKMTENMRKEAQMQKEAEELLVSLGISLDSIPAPAVKEEQPGQQGPSRDELKASLKIDTNKKNLLKRIKEYR